ncbi:DUF2330 domain-containing protein [Planctomycetota bacterium]|nr:DUF2330 domain-containing protein [Planctomycetota bacterium]
MRFFGLLILLLFASHAPSCCMVPRSYPGDVDQKGQKVLIMHHDGRQELVLQVAPHFIEKKNDTPGYLAWLVTVPNKPLAYDIADKKIFDQARRLQGRLDDLADEQSRPSDTDNMTIAAPAGGLRIDDPINVGPYVITPVTTLGEEALQELNAYLNKRGFPTEDPDHMSWFVKNNFTFLCIHVTPPEGQRKLGQALELPPLQISFETESPYYPGMYSANQGNFSLAMHILSGAPLTRASIRSQTKKLRAGGSTSIDNLWTAKPLAESLTNLTTDWKEKPSHWFINTITSSGFNPTENGKPVILNWKEDVFFALGGAKDMPPAWYKGDGKPPILNTGPDDEFTAQLRWLLTIFVVLALVFTWAWLIVRSKEGRKELLEARERALRGENPASDDSDAEPATEAATDATPESPESMEKNDD